MSRYLEIAEEVMQKIRARRRLEKTGDTSGLPWPGYNGGKQFHCDLCDAYFDTGSGMASHEAYGCDSQRTPRPVVHRTLPSCPKCGSFVLYREKDGRLTCQTCEDRGIIQ